MQELKEKGNLEYQNNNFDKALEYYSQALEIDPENPILWSNKSAALLKLEKADEAVVAAAEATKRKPTWSKAWNRLISALILKEDYDSARKSISKALAIDPNNNTAKQLLKEVNKKEFCTLKKEELDGDGEDTEDEGDGDGDGEVVESIDTSNLLPQQNTNPPMPQMPNQNMLFQSMMKNDKLKEKLSNPEFQRKIMESQSNPFAAMADPDIMEAMQEMMSNIRF